MSVRSEWGVVCPQCGSDSQLYIVCEVHVRLFEDGTEVVNGDHEWDDKSKCSCDKCGWEGTVGDAQDANEDGVPYDEAETE